MKNKNFLTETEHCSHAGTCAST